MHVVTLLRKPLSKNETVASNSCTHGTGGINIQECRVDSHGEKVAKAAGTLGGYKGGDEEYKGKYVRGTGSQFHDEGRFPANLILTSEATEKLDRQSGDRPGMPKQQHRQGLSKKGYDGGWGADPGSLGYGDTGGASRFFKQVKLD